MDITFLLQGYEPALELSVGNQLINFLSHEGSHTFTGIFAFASEAGVLGLSDYIAKAKNNFESLNLIVGVDQEGTSREALLEINNLEINSYIFYQKESPIFHPKIYLFEGAVETKLIVGSSNLTATGLFSNVEASLLVEFSSDDVEGERLLSDLKDQFKGLFDFSDPNLFRISSEIIEAFVAQGIVPPEKARFRKYRKQADLKEQKECGLEIPKRATAKIPSIFRGKPKTDRKVSKIIQELEIKDAICIEPNSLVWQKKNLPKSDAQQVSGDTKITAVLRLNDAGFKVSGVKIDRNAYFRNEVFGNLKWTMEERKHNTPLQVAKCKFKISIDGKNLGVHELRISHDPERVAGQNNVPTTIHWGSVLIPYLKKTNLAGKSLSLFSPPNNSSVFRIDIE